MTLNNFVIQVSSMKKTTKDFKYCKILGCFINFLYVHLAHSIMLNARAHVRNTRAHVHNARTHALGGRYRIGSVL